LRVDVIVVIRIGEWINDGLVDLGWSHVEVVGEQRGDELADPALLIRALALVVWGQGLCREARKEAREDGLLQGPRRGEVRLRLAVIPVGSMLCVPGPVLCDAGLALCDQQRDWHGLCCGALCYSRDAKAMLGERDVRQRTPSSLFMPVEFSIWNFQIVTELHAALVERAVMARHTRFWPGRAIGVAGVTPLPLPTLATVPARPATAVVAVSVHTALPLASVHTALPLTAPLAALG
jgi:hypothetical protein